MGLILFGMGRKGDLNDKPPRPFVGEEDPLLKALKEAHPERDPSLARNKEEAPALAQPAVEMETPRAKTLFIIKAVADEFSVTRELIANGVLGGNVGRARRIATYILSGLAGRSYEQILQPLGYRTRASIWHACNHVMKLMGEDPALKQKIEKLEAMIQTRYPEMKKKKTEGSGN